MRRSLPLRWTADLAALIVGTALIGHQQPWTPQTGGTTAELRGLSIVDENIAWASGQRGTVLRTTDGGRSWRADTIPGATTLDMRSIDAISAMTAVAASAGEAERGLARFFRTTDGGRTWTQVFSTTDTGVFFDAVRFWDDRHGIAMSDPVGGKLFLLRTEDGGATWSRIPPAVLPPMLPGEAAFAASGQCVAVQGTSNVWIATGGADTARVFRSADRGATWTVVNTPVRSGGGVAGIFAVAFADARRGVVVGGNYQQPRQPSLNVAVTDDGGRSWRAARGPMPPGYMSSVAFARGPNVVAVGLAGTAVSADRGETWTMVDSIAYNAVGFARGSASGGWAVGPRGRVARWQR
jgi:photosystem II stability/assembly factor-like uncharacterized protein